MNIGQSEGSEVKGCTPDGIGDDELMTEIARWRKEERGVGAWSVREHRRAAAASSRGFALLVGTGLNSIFRRRGQPLRGNLALAAMMVVVLACVHIGFVIFSPELSSKKIALEIERAYRPGDTIVINGKYEFGSTLNYYTGIQLHVLNGRDGNLWFGSLFPGAPQIFEDNSTFARLWAGSGRVFLFTEDYLKDRALEDIDPSKVFVFARQGGKVVLTNQPLPGISR